MGGTALACSAGLHEGLHGIEYGLPSGTLAGSRMLLHRFALDIPYPFVRVVTTRLSTPGCCCLLVHTCSDGWLCDLPPAAGFSVEVPCAGKNMPCTHTLAYSAVGRCRATSGWARGQHKMVHANICKLELLVTVWVTLLWQVVALRSGMLDVCIVW